MSEISFRLNGRPVTAAVAGYQRLVDLLREDLGCTEVKEGCGEGECGACTVLLDGKPVTSCIMFAFQVEGREVTTVKGLGPEELARIEEAMVSQGAVQCGFCTPGLVLTIKALLDEDPSPTLEGIRLALSGNLCRCTGYEMIFRATARLSGGEGGHE